jgi:chorismate dehydratase
LPLYYGLVKNGLLKGMELLKGTPTELTRLFLQGKLDISPIPSIEYARNSRELLLLPELVVSKKTVHELDGQGVALANTSATSQVLAKIILERKYGVRPRYFVSPPVLSAVFLEADAVLLIGDDALRIMADPRGLHLYDLGFEWKEFTGEKMVYAVWVVRRDYALSRRKEVKQALTAFQGSMRYSSAHLDEMVREVAQWEGFSPRFLRDYLGGLNFHFGDDYQSGLLTFLGLAKEVGAIGEVPTLDFVEVD